MKIPANVLAALAAATTDGNRLVLTGPRMDPKMYQRVNEVLEACGGRWTSAAGAHLFPADAQQCIADALTTGQIATLREKRNDAQFFPTPAAVVQRLIELADIQPGVETLEPSAGVGAIAAALAGAGAVVDCIERDPGYAAALDGFRSVHCADFLTVTPEPAYDRIVMNPPFTKGADMAHVEHALRFLKPAGLLISVMSWAVTYSSRNTARFRDLVQARGGAVEPVAAGAFKESGTDVDTVIVTIPATRPANPTPLVWPTREVAPIPEPEFRDPAEILDEIRADLREAMAAFDDLAASLAAPAPAARATEVVHLPRPEGQLAFDDLDAAS